MKIIKIYSGKPSYKRALLRQTSWWMCHWRNAHLHISPNWKSIHFWHWNIQLIIVGTTKVNSALEFRFLNWTLEVGW